MDITIFLAKFWGGLYILLGLSSIAANFLGRVIGYTEDRTITISTGYISLTTVASPNLWVKDWRITITLIGWMTLIKGTEKVVFPMRVNKIAQKFDRLKKIWGLVILLIGVWFLWMAIRHQA